MAGAMPAAASTGAARRAASCAKLNRCSPTAPPRAGATPRARSSAAPRDADDDHRAAVAVRALEPFRGLAKTPRAASDDSMMRRELKERS